MSNALIDEFISEIDQKLSAQLDAIMHDPEVQKLESAWRSLKFLVDRTDFRENIKIEIMNASKEELLEDFEDSPEVPKSGLYKTIYTAEYGQFGGQPYSNIIANYDFGPGPQDVKLLQYVAAVSAMSHAPFISGGRAPVFRSGQFHRIAQPEGPALHFRRAAIHQMAIVQGVRRRTLCGLDHTRGFCCDLPLRAGYAAGKEFQL